jgi:hypothetical protein
MSKFNDSLKSLDDDALADAAAALSRETARRSQRPVAEMDDNQYRRWVDTEIAKADAARVKAAQEQADD